MCTGCLLHVRIPWCLLFLYLVQQKADWLISVAFISIVTATIATIISIGVQAPDHVEFHATTTANFADAFLAVTNIVFAYGMLL